MSVQLKPRFGRTPNQNHTGNIMTEYEYPECTTSVVTALAIFKKRYSTYRSKEIDAVTAKAIKYLHDTQYSHGGWFGSWGICFTYATMFALESLSLVGETYSTSPAARKACEFLVNKQRDDGGWGESYKVSSIVQQSALIQILIPVRLHRVVKSTIGWNIQSRLKSCRPPGQRWH